MSEPLFLLQIVHPDGTLVQFPGGGALERDLVEACVTEVVSRGVGLFCTEAHVAADVRAGVRAAILNLKRETIPLVKK